MNNSVVAFNPCGIEVSHLTLLVALRTGDRDEPPREFPNTAEGHQSVLRFLNRSVRPVRVALESTGLYGLDLALARSSGGRQDSLLPRSEWYLPRTACHPT